MTAVLLEGKTAIITGSGSGVGRASALRFTEEGASVVCADVDTEGASCNGTVRPLGVRAGEAFTTSPPSFNPTSDVTEAICGNGSSTSGVRGDPSEGAGSNAMPVVGNTGKPVR